MLFAQFILNSVEIFFIQCAQYILLPVSMYESRTSPLHIATFSSDQFYATLNEHRTLLFPSYAPVISNPRSDPPPHHHHPLRNTRGKPGIFTSFLTRFRFPGSQGIHRFFTALLYRMRWLSGGIGGDFTHSSRLLLEDWVQSCKFTVLPMWQTEW